MTGSAGQRKWAQKGIAIDPICRQEKFELTPKKKSLEDSEPLIYSKFTMVRSDI
jgi:hypothetical protein